MFLHQSAQSHLVARFEASAKSRTESNFCVWHQLWASSTRQPLALCDALSIESKNCVPADLVYADKVGEVYRLLTTLKHRCFYFPRLERNEAILLKCYDSKEDGTARFSAHTAFR